MEFMESGKIELGNWKVKSGSSRLRAAGCAGIYLLDLLKITYTTTIKSLYPMYFISPT